MAAQSEPRLVDFLAALKARDPALVAALRVVSFRCDGNEDSEAAFDRVWQALAEKILGPKIDGDSRAALVGAAENYGRALRHQDELATALDLAYSRGEDGEALDRDHSAACDALGEAEHDLLVSAAVVGGWTRQDAEESV